jgi:hypothetical protein
MKLIATLIATLFAATVFAAEPTKPATATTASTAVTAPAAPHKAEAKKDEKKPVKSQTKASVTVEPAKAATTK